MSAPLGVFDSGVGGLTVVHALRQRLPGESIIYVGDTARVPYGNKSREAVTRYSLEIGSYLCGRGGKAVVVACNTASAFALEALQRELPVPVTGVIRPGVEAALAATRTGRVGIIGTAGTIGSRAYQELLLAARPELQILAKAAPMLVPLVEENYLEHAAARLIVEDYLGEFRESGIDTLVLACTHYPLLLPLIREVAGAGVVLVDSASTCAAHVERMLDDRGTADGLELYLTDLSPNFKALAERFLQCPVGEIGRVTVGH